jgi:hypothetical protein
MPLKTTIFNHLKNIAGWRTNRKILVFSVDDYGNVRLDSKNARDNLTNAGLQIKSYFDQYDSLESSLDLEALYDVLTSVKDKNNSHAVFTPYAVPCNLDFESIVENDFSKIEIETLPITYKKLESRYPSSYTGTWDLWQQGISEKILLPQFHGREHFNFKTIDNRLKTSDKDLIFSIRNRSLTGLTLQPNELQFSVTFAYKDFSDNKFLESVITDGLNKFEEVFGYRATCFMPPSATISSYHHKLLSKCGIKSMDTYVYKRHSYSDNLEKKEFRWLGKQVEKLDMSFIVRNAVFEPAQESNALEKCKCMIDAAFRMNKPAIVSSHRINFVGFIDESIRKNSLTELKNLLNWIIKKFPDVEFMGMDSLQNIIRRTNGISNL